MWDVLDTSPEATFPELQPAGGHSPLMSKEGGKKAPTMSLPAMAATGDQVAGPHPCSWASRPEGPASGTKEPLALARARSSTVASRVCLVGLCLAAEG